MAGVKGGEEGCCVRSMQYSLVLFNFLTTITGGGLIGLGVYYKLESAPYKEIFNSGIISVPFFVIAAGSMLFVIGFMGCCSVMCEMRCLLKCYLAILLILLLIQVGTVAIFFALEELVTDYLTKTMREQTIQEYDQNKQIKEGFDLVQAGFQCCGAVNYTDWQGSSWQENEVNSHLNKVPASCCKGYEAGEVSCATTDAYQEGCAKAFYIWVDKKIIIIAVVLGLVLSVQLVLAMFGCGVNNHLHNRVSPLL